MAGGALATLELADWRRRVADLYAEVRATAATDPKAAWDAWRTTREALFREHPQSPVPPPERASFRARHFDYDPAYRFGARLERDEAAGDPHGDEPVAAAPAPFALPVSAGGTMSFGRIGWVEVQLPAGPSRLAVYWLAGYAGGLFLPFRDATNGAETYGAGRYLIDAAKSADLGGSPADGTLVIDFNFAFQPSCAFDPRWACPLAPPENRLAVRVEAGERLA
jgi:uncharacterized protein (DUF1684 family)